MMFIQFWREAVLDGAVLVAVLFLLGADGDPIKPSPAIVLTDKMEPPKKPERFASVAEVNKYLADLSDYFSVLARPR